MSEHSDKAKELARVIRRLERAKAQVAELEKARAALLAALGG